jgi:hypothetical protein
MECWFARLRAKEANWQTGLPAKTLACRRQKNSHVTG